MFRFRGDDRARPKRGRRLLAAVVVVGSIASVAVVTTPVAQAQKLPGTHTERYASQDMPIKNWATYAADGTPIAVDPNCPNVAGVYRWSKVWSDTYGGDEPLHSVFRMQFHTTYSAAVAAAKAAYQNAGVNVSCSTYNAFKGAGPVASSAFVACSLPAHQPARFCQLARNNINDPALDAGLSNVCSVNPGGPYPVQWHEWHNVNSLLYNVSLIFHINIPVYLDDFSFIGGVRNFDQASGQPAFGDTWLGYGHVQTPAAGELSALWYDSAAWRLGLNPAISPVAAHRAVDDAIAAGRAPKGVVGSSGLITHAQLRDILCAWTPKLSDYLDGGGVASMAGLGEDMSNWVKAETGLTICQNIQRIPRFLDVAALACNNTFIGAIFVAIDNNQCMNQPDNVIAVKLHANLGCTRNAHLSNLFNQLKAFLGG